MWSNKMLAIGDTTIDAISQKKNILQPKEKYFIRSNSLFLINGHFFCENATATYS